MTTPSATSAVAPPLAPAPNRAAWWTAVAVTLAAAVVPAVVHIGDIGYMQDEPRLLAKAFHANQRGGVETHGLNGNFGVPYGPLPTQIYQLLLLVTHDPVVIAGIRAALCAGVTAAGLLWLARTLRLNPWFATAVVLAPYVWNFHRLIWDATFAIPIGTTALAAYAAHLRTDSRRALLLAGACMLALLFIHPQDAPLVAPLGVHMLWRRPAALARSYAGVAVVLGVMLALNWGYFREVYYAVEWHLRHHTLKTEYAIQPPPRTKALLTPLQGGSLLSGKRFAEQDSRLREPAGVVRAASYATLLAYPLIWAGIGVMLFEWIARMRGRRPAITRHDQTRAAVFGIALVGLLVQVAMYGVMRIPPEPQYFFGTFALHVLFAWAAVDALRRVYLDWPVIAVYGLAGGFITVASILHIHHRGYDRAFPRPSLANQVQVARELNRYADPAVWTDVEQYKAHPQGIRSLRLLIAPDRPTPQRPGKRLLIRYRSGPTGTDAAIELAELPEDAEPDPRFQPLDVSPLPPNWHPAGW